MLVKILHIIRQNILAKIGIEAGQSSA
jgi:hypothetical protein